MFWTGGTVLILAAKNKKKTTEIKGLAARGGGQTRVTTRAVRIVVEVGCKVRERSRVEFGVESRRVVNDPRKECTRSCRCKCGEERGREE